MSKTYDFLKECGVFYVLTTNEGRPAGRPFGAVMEHEGKLYLSTSCTKAVYKQLKASPEIQIIALNPGSRQWVRIDGTAAECSDLSMKQRMLEACPPLTNHYPTAAAENFALFAIEDMHALLNVGTEFVSID